MRLINIFFNKIVIFGIFLLLVYAFAKSNIPKITSKDFKEIISAKGEEKLVTESFEGNFLERSLSKIFANLLKTDIGKAFFSNMIQPIDQKNPSQTLKLSEFKPLSHFTGIETTGESHGEQAFCGSKVKVSYEVHDMVTGDISQSNDRIFRLGSRKNELDSFAIGMKAGEVKSGFWGDKKLFFTMHEVLDNEPSEIRIFDDMISNTMPVLCGQVVSFDLDIKEVTGRTIVNSKENIILLGGDQTPIAFSYGLHQKTLGNRILISPAKYLKNYNNNLPQWLKVKDSEFVIIEFSNVNAKQH
jgi:hypothetical protein